MKGPIIRITGRDLSDFGNRVRLFIETVLVDTAYVADRFVAWLENAIATGYFTTGKFLIRYYLIVSVVFLTILVLTF